MTDRKTPLLEVRSLSKRYPRTSGRFFSRDHFYAVKDVSFAIQPGETFGIVGESGCGKSTVARLIMALEKPDGGEVLLDGQRIDHLPERTLRPSPSGYSGFSPGKSTTSICSTAKR